MRFRSLALLAATVVASLGGAHGSFAYTRTTDSCRQGPGEICINQTSSGHSVTVQVRDTVQVTLDDRTLIWSSVREVGPTLLRVTKNATRTPRELSETFRAVSRGRTTLQATGRPRCAPNQACPEFILLWRVQILVES